MCNDQLEALPPPSFSLSRCSARCPPALDSQRAGLVYTSLTCPDFPGARFSQFVLGVKRQTQLHGPELKKQLLAVTLSLGVS